MHAVEDAFNKRYKVTEHFLSTPFFKMIRFCSGKKSKTNKTNQNQLLKPRKSLNRIGLYRFVLMHESVMTYRDIFKIQRMSDRWVRD